MPTFQVKVKREVLTGSGRGQAFAEPLGFPLGAQQGVESRSDAEGWLEAMLPVGSTCVVCTVCSWHPLGVAAGDRMRTAGWEVIES